MCFKCNEVGHTARECKAKNLIHCAKCNGVGHKESRCLKVWEPPSDGLLRLMKCIECGRHGHLKCTTEKESNEILIDTKVMEDLDEFVHSKFEMAEQSDDVELETKDVDAFDYV